MFLFWGPQHLCFYNDAYRPSLDNEGKHPNALGKPGAEVWPEIWPVIKPLIDQVLSGGEATWSENQLIPIYRNGQLEDVYWTFSYSPVSDESENTAGVFVTCTETTQQIAAHQRLTDNQRQVLRSFEQSPVGIAIIRDPDLTFRMANPFYGELVGRTPENIINKPLLEALPELRGQGFDTLLNEVIATGVPFIANEVAVDIVRHEQLETIYVDLTYQPEYGTDNSASGVLVIATDVTQQVRARQTVEASAARLRSIIATAPAAMGLFVGRDLIVELPNQAFIDIVGKGPAIEGKPLREVMPELENQAFLQILDDVYTSGKMFQSFGTQVNIVQHGVMTHNFYNITYTPLRDDDGKVYAILDIAIDVTEQVLIRQRLEAAQVDLVQTTQRLGLALDAGRLGSYDLDLETGLMTCTAQCKANFGLEPQAPFNFEDLLRSIMDEDRPQMEQAVADALDAHTIYQAEYRVIWPDGTLHWIKASGQPAYSSNGQPVSISGITQEITVQRELQLALEQQVQERTEELEATNEELAATNEELAATNEELIATNEEFTSANNSLEEANHNLTRSNQNLEQFAYIASHDLQEPLRKIQQFGDLLKTRYVGSVAEELVYLERMQSAASRMSALIKDLLTFSRISTSQASVSPVALMDIVNQAQENLSVAIEETNAHIQVDTLPVVQGDSLQLSQLFQNLLSNAIKFRRTGTSDEAVIPQITIEADQVVATDLPASIKPARYAATYHRIKVTDNGIGFDEKYVNRIFQVFQRLHGKNEFAGTGVGLAICEKVAVNHGGGITATSQPGKGTTFYVYLPQ